MRNIFVVNPAAGQGAGNVQFIEKIREASKKLGIDVEIYTTKGVKDGTVFVKETCEKADADEQLRFFACGGDGTFNEVVNGVYGFENAACGVVPIGTGNDFIRNFGDASFFSDIELQLRGIEKKIDLIKYTSEYKGDIVSGYCANMFNIGFDANVVDETNILKKKPFISGSLAYLLGVATMFIKKKGADLKIEVDGQTLHSGRLLLCAIANGCFCGGGIKGIPKAVTDDGLMDISIINNVSRLTFAMLFTKYVKGTHLETKTGQKEIKYLQKNNVTVTSLGHPMRMCVDGEMMDSDKLILENKALAVKFILPLGIA